VTILNISPSELYCNSTSLVWEDNDKEVVYKNTLYDVLSIKGNGFTVELMVVSDGQEMELKHQFASLYEVSSHKATKNPLNLLKVFFALKFIPASADIEFNNPDEHGSSFYPAQSFVLVNETIAKDGPPPDLFI
jgi:hypothetical protein